MKNVNLIPCSLLLAPCSLLLALCSLLLAPCSLLLALCSLLLAPCSSLTAQTEDYSVASINSHQPRTYTFQIGPDTLDATSDPDTLIIDFEQSFYGYMGGYLSTTLDSLATGGSTVLAGTAELQHSQCASCPWKQINASDIDIPLVAGIANSVEATGWTLPNTRLRMRIIGTAGKSAIRTWVTLKQL